MGGKARDKRAVHAHVSECCTATAEDCELKWSGSQEVAFLPFSPLERIARFFPLLFSALGASLPAILGLDDC